MYSFVFLFRMFHSEKKEEPCQGFIDGDLVETFLDLDRSAVMVLVVVVSSYVAVFVVVSDVLYLAYVVVIDGRFCRDLPRP